MLLSQTSTQSPEKEKITCIWICRYLKRKASHGRVPFSQWVNELIQVTCIEIQNGWHSIGHSPPGQDLPSRRQYICEGQRETDKIHSGSQQVPGQGQEADNVCLGPRPGGGRLPGVLKYACCAKELENKKEEEGGRTMEQWKSQRRKQQHVLFIKRKEGHEHLSKMNKNRKWGERLRTVPISSPCLQRPTGNSTKSTT